MLFNSGDFLFFFAVVLVAYYVVRNRVAQNVLLLAASYVFYGWWDYRFLTLIIISTLVDYAAGRRIHTHQAVGRDRSAKLWLLASVAVNLGMLGFFKYFGFFSESLAALARSFGIELNTFTLHVILPVGISFYTFQTMSYSIDVFRGRMQPVRNIVDFSLFVAFFPQLMAGPIERARNLVPQIQAPRKLTEDLVQTGCWLILWGLFKKVFIADSLAPYTDWAFAAQGATTGLDLYVAGVAFCFRFYCDFSGYSDMAIGLAALLGIRLSTNFRLPYFATNPADFWAKWHITLSSWFRDYVYRYLRGRQPQLIRASLALVGTMSLVGLWHGAAWTYVLWGTAWGAVLALHRLSQPLIRATAGSSPLLTRVAPAGGAVLTFHLWLVLGYLFVANSLGQGLHMQFMVLAHPFSHSGTTLVDAYTIAIFIAPLLMIQSAQLLTGDRFVVLSLPAYLRVAVYTILILLMLAKGIQYPRAFIYFQF